MKPLSLLAVGLALLVAVALVTTFGATASDTGFSASENAQANFLLDDPGDARDTASMWYQNNVPNADPNAVSTPAQNAALRSVGLEDTGVGRRLPSKRRAANALGGAP
jgi:hypothetical protein